MMKEAKNVTIDELLKKAYHIATSYGVEIDTIFWYAEDPTDDLCRVYSKLENSAHKSEFKELLYQYMIELKCGANIEATRLESKLAVLYYKYGYIRRES